MTVTRQDCGRWLERLAELVSFEETGPGDGGWRWRCGDPETGDRLALSKQAASELGLPHPDLMAAVSGDSHRCCDCEILFNLSEEFSQ